MAETTGTELAIPEEGVGLNQTNEAKSSFMEAVGTADMMRQLVLVVALVVCIAIAIFIVIWAQEPEYRPLGTYPTDELITKLDYFDQNGIQYRLEGNTVSVLADEFQAIKLGLARQGVNIEMDNSGDIIMQDMGFGVSQRLELERLKHAREQRIARTIEKMNAVQKAQVLLAIPKENVFARQASKPSATVVISTRRGTSLDAEEVDSIVDIVASAVQGLSPESVTVSDSNGRLLNSGSQNSISARARKEYEIEQKREAEYLQKIDSILIPILGMGNYTAQVDVTMDFTTVEQTQRRYNPDLPAVRSEQTSESITSGSVIAGIPGALTNQPPLDSNIPEEAGGEAGGQGSNPQSSTKEATRNFELDTTISHTKQQTGVLQRLSVSVAVDFVAGAATAEGETAMQPRSQEELLNIRRVLQGGIGFDVSRGDTLEVVSIPFNRMDLGTVVEPPLWEQPRFMALVKLALSALVIIILILFVVRPMLKRLIDPASAQDVSEFDADEGLDLGDDDMEMLKEFDADQVGFASDGSLTMPDLRRDEDVLKAVRTLVANEPELAAQVVNGWLIMDE